MRDPIGSFDKILDNFILYIKTAFGTQCPGLERERERMLRTIGNFYQEPWIELLPRYISSQKKIEDLNNTDLPGLDEATISDFKSFVLSGLVPKNIALHQHQLEMLRRVLEGHNTVITSGSGSGKTEAFLLPLFAYLASESRNWDPPNEALAHQDDWWSNDDWQQACRQPHGRGERITQSYRIGQRAHEQRDPAVGALILYPMNALVEDQLTRLRKAVDSQEAHNWFTNHRQGNQIFIGRYNGNTPVAGREFNQNGNPNRKKIEELKRELEETHRVATAAQEYARAPGEDQVKFFFPRLDGAEMRCRWDMQDSPPDILITNYSMLSIMLMREADAPIFERTKRWLEKENSIFHLIIDELHLYRGTAGTEVAYLYRLLLDRLGLTPDSPKLRILASSASLESDPDSLKFLKDFFGTEWNSDQIITSSPPPLPAVNGAQFLDPVPFRQLADAEEQNNSEKQLEAYQAISERLGYRGTESDPIERLAKAMESEEAELEVRLARACISSDEPRAVSLSDFGNRMFGTPRSSPDTRNAARGLLCARSICNWEDRQSQLPALRLHWFFRNIEGLWACTVPGCQSLPGENADDRTTGKLFCTTSPVLCGNRDEQHRVFELLYCEQCGTTLFGGRRLLLLDGRWEFLQTEPDIEGIPDRQAARFVDGRTYQEFAVFWPVGNASLEGSPHWTQGGIVAGNKEDARWDRAS